MVFKQDFKKVFVRDLFLFGSFATFAIYGVGFNNIDFELQDLFFIIFIILFAVLGCLSHYWYYFEVTDKELVKHIFGTVKSIPVSSIKELSYENNPARPLVYIVFNKPNGNEDYIEFTTSIWAPNTLYSLNETLHSKNLDIKIRFDDKTQKHFEKDKDYHLSHPKSIFGWIILGLKQVILGSLVSVILIAILEYI